MKAEMRLPFAVLCTVPLIMVLGNSMLIPLLPSIRNALDISLMQAGLLITVFSLPAGIVIPLAGYLSDRLGRKVIMAPALLIYGLGGLISGAAAVFLANPYPVLLAGRIVQGIGAGGTYQLAMALTGDVFQSQERSKALGLLEAANGLGKVVSPILGAGLGLLAWFAPFFVYGLLAIPIALSVWFVVKEPGLKSKKANSGQAYFQQLKSIFQQKGVSLAACYFAGAAVLFILFGVLSWFADILEQSYAIKGLATGLVIAIPVAIMAATSYLVGSFLQKQTASTLKLAVVLGLSLTAAGVTAAAFWQGIYPLVGSLMVMGLGTGMVLPAINTLITSAAETAERGIITCFYGTMRFFGVAAGPPLFSAASSWGITAMLLGAAGLAALSAAVAALFIHTQTMMGHFSAGKAR